MVGGVVRAEVEPAQPVDPGALAVGDVVQVVLDRGGEVVVDQPGEVGLEQPDDRERRPGRHQRRALLPDVAAVLDGLHDRGVGGRAADAELLHRLHQRRLGVAGGRGGAVPVRLEVARVEGVAAGQLRQPLLGVVALGRALVGVLDVGAQEAGEGDRAPGRREHDRLAARRAAADAHRDGGADRVGHLRGQRALPDQLVEPEFLGVELAGDLAQAYGTRRRPGGSPRAPPGRSSPCGCRCAARPARTRRRTARGPGCGRPTAPSSTGSSSRCACR